MNDDELLKAKIAKLRAARATPDEIAAFVDEWDRTHSAAPAASDRTDQTIRNPNGQDPLVKYGVPAAAMAAGLGTGVGVEALLARLAGKSLAGAIGTGIASNMASGATTRALLADKGQRAAAAANPGAAALDALLGGAIGGASAVGTKGASALLKRLGFNREGYGAEMAGQKIADDLAKSKLSPDDVAAKATGRAGDDALVLNAGQPMVVRSHDAVRNSREAHTALLGALNQQQLGAKDRARALVQKIFGKGRGTQPEMQQALAVTEHERALKPAYERAYGAYPDVVTDPAVLDAVKRGEAALPKGAPEQITEDLTKLAPNGTFIREAASAPTDADIVTALQTKFPNLPVNRLTPDMIAVAKQDPEILALAGSGGPRVSPRYAHELKSRVGETAKHNPPTLPDPKHGTHIAAQGTDETVLRDALHAAYPELQRADELYSTNAAQQNALKAGHEAAGASNSATGRFKFSNTTSDAASPASERLAQGAFREGQRARYMEKIEGASPAADPLTSVVGTDAQRALIDHTAQGNRAAEVGPTIAKEQALRADASQVGDPLVPREADVSLDPGEWSIRQGYVGNVLFPGADVAARLGKRNMARVNRAADDVIGRVYAGRVRDPQSIQALKDAIARTLAAQSKRASRAQRLATLLGTGSGTLFNDQ